MKEVLMRKRGLFKKQSDQEKKESIFPISIKVLEEKIRKELPGEQDLFIQEHEQSGKKLLLFGVPYLIEKVDLNDYLLEPLLEKKINWTRSEEHTSELQSRENLVCRLLLEKKKK